MSAITLTEKRFREGLGERYLADGVTVRCQGQAKNQLAQWREDHEDMHTPNDDIWPECQCTRGAVPGMFACKYHGGITKSKNPPKNIFDIIPVDLGEKLALIAENPMYISRRDEILMLQARNLQILEELNDETSGNAEAWGMVVDAIVELNRGNELGAKLILDTALKQRKKTTEVWQEYRANVNVLKDLTNTQVRTAKELQQMATTEQVTALIRNVVQVIIDGTEKYLGNDRVKQSEFLGYVSSRVAGLTNFRADAVIDSIAASSREENRTS